MTEDKVSVPNIPSIAFCLSGVARLWKEKSRVSFLEMIHTSFSEFDVDFYVCTWDRGYDNIPEDHPDNYKVTPDLFEELHPKYIGIREMSQIDEDLKKGYPKNHVNLFYHLENIHICNQFRKMGENDLNKKYDFVVRTRLDLEFGKVYTCDLRPTGVMYNVASNVSGDGRPSDVMYFSSGEIMDQFIDCVRDGSTLENGSRDPHVHLQYIKDIQGVQLDHRGYAHLYRRDFTSSEKKYVSN
jgi:hypothetical protein